MGWDALSTCGIEHRQMDKTRGNVTTNFVETEAGFRH